MSKKFLRWSKVPYAGESKPPGDSVTSTAYLQQHSEITLFYKFKS